MTEVLENSSILNNEDNSRMDAYSNGLEHLLDELKRLDLLVGLEVIRSRRIGNTGKYDLFRGLVVTDDEVHGLLTDEVFTETQDMELHTLYEELGRIESAINSRKRVSLKAGIYLPLCHITRLFNLTPFEEQCLVICFGIELDCKYEKCYAFLQDDVTRKKPSIGLIVRLLCSSKEEKLKAFTAFMPEAALPKYLIHILENPSDNPTPLVSKPLKLDDRIVNFLLEDTYTDLHIEPFTRLVYPKEQYENLLLDRDIQMRIQQFMEVYFFRITQNRKSLVFYFHGPYGAGKKLQAEMICRQLNMRMMVVDLKKILDKGLFAGDVLRRIGREVVLQQAALCFDSLEYMMDQDDRFEYHVEMLLEIIGEYSMLTFFIGEHPWKPPEINDGMVFLEMKFDVPDMNARKHIWSNLSRTYKLSEDINTDDLAVKFRFTPGRIKDSLSTAQFLSYWRMNKNGLMGSSEIFEACRFQSNSKLGALAQKVTARYSQGDIVLPPKQAQLLRNIISQVKYRNVVLEDWGFDRKLSLGKGINILFAGPPGTGKTMAAEVIANELGLELYKIDLAGVVSKYIGETEKNLKSIFNEAGSSNAILFFDEADALFGKRSEVKDAHDRYANVEIAYLLQKMEEYEGITILSTNLRCNMDHAFVRRLQFVVEFAMPDEGQRKRIWHGIFPGEAPLAEDADLNFMAHRFRISGGHIKNIALGAAFLAVEDGGIIRMRHLILASMAEMQKTGELCRKEDFGIYSDLVR